MNFTGYILAGGKSSRMGADKAFLKSGGKTFLENAAESLKSSCEQIKIVLNSSQTHFIEKLPRGVSHIFDVYENRGAPGGIHAALKNCETKYAIILAVDLPFVNDKAINKLVEITLFATKFAAVVPRQTDGRMQPLCASYNARYCLLVLENLLNKTASASADDFLDLISPRIIEQKNLTTDESNDIFFNVNRPSDFQRINAAN